MRKVSLIPGDGIGREITRSVQAIFAAAGADIQWEVVNMGLETYELSGTLIPQEFIDSLGNTSVALKGPTTTPVGGGHRSINVTLRQMFNLYANVRPIMSLPGVTTRFDGIDLIIVRENTEDLYKGIEYKVGDRVAHGIKLITADASERIGRHAFELAQKLNRKKVTAVHKANIMKFTDGLFLESVRKVSADYPHIKFEDIIIDNCCLQLVTKPEQFDVIVTENLYGDILSDLAAGLVGGLGVAPGANLGASCAIFEAAHGSAPDIAGKNLANPTALILSGVMMLEHLDQAPTAKRIRQAMALSLADPNGRTKDLGGTKGTEEFTQVVIKNLLKS